MKLLFSIITLFFAGTIFLFSCSEDSGTNSENESDVIIPLKVGNSWVFSNGDELRVFASTTVNGEEAYEMKLYESDGHVDDVGSWANRSDGLYTESRDTLKLMLKYPGSVDEKYNIDEHGYYQITSISKTVSVPAGEFSDCYEYIHYYDGFIVETFIFKPKIGPIIFDKDVELVSYSLK